MGANRCIGCLDQVWTLLLAGHETTANTLTWTWYLLSQSPEIERRLHAELNEVLGGRVPTAQDLPELKYTRMVLEEALRLYPPTPLLSRKALANDELQGYPITANSMIMISPYATHRHPALWEEPERFDPERFTPERAATRPAYAYFPFGGGPHVCIGNHFAMMEAQLILSTVAQRYQLRLLPGHPVEPPDGGDLASPLWFADDHPCDRTGGKPAVMQVLPGETLHNSAGYLQQKNRCLFCGSGKWHRNLE